MVRGPRFTSAWDPHPGPAVLTSGWCWPSQALLPQSFELPISWTLFPQWRHSWPLTSLDLSYIVSFSVLPFLVPHLNLPTPPPSPASLLHFSLWHLWPSSMPLLFYPFFKAHHQKGEDSTKGSLGKTMVSPVVMYGCESWTTKKAECLKLMFLNCGVREDSWESQGQQGHQTSQSERKSTLNIGRTDAEAEAPVVWSPDVRPTHWKRC